MRRLKNALLVLFTLALVAAGAVMPFAVSRLQDARQAGVETRSFDSFLLTLKKKGELSQILRFLSENASYEFTEDDPGKAVLSEEEVLEAAMETVTMMLKCGVISKDIVSVIEMDRAAGVDRPDIDMARIIPEDDARTSFIVWGVDWYNLGLQIWLDDASGKAFQIDRFTGLMNREYYDSKASTGMTKEQFYAQMDNWCVFLESYYEMEVQDIQEVPYSDAYEQKFLLYIEPEDGGSLIPIGIFLYEDGAILYVEYNAWTD